MNTRPNRWSQWIVRGLVGLFGAFVLLVIGAAAYQAWATARDSRAYPPPGELVDVGGHELHIHCVGTGSPTVILESGLGSGVLSWQLVQDEIARTTRVCSYDRAGLGWSDPAPAQQDLEQVVASLQELLKAADVGGPYVLAGHSLGGILVRVFATSWPQDVVGLVLVDSSHEGQRPRLPAEMWTMLEGYQLMLRRMRLVAPFGLLRFTAMDDISGYLPDSLRATGTALGHRSHTIDTVHREWTLFNTSQFEVLEPGYFSAMPLFVLTRGKPVSDAEAPGLSTETRQEFSRSWNELQQELAALSSNSARVIAENSEHYIMIDQPELVVDAVQRVVEAARNGTPINEAAPDSDQER